MGRRQTKQTRDKISAGSTNAWARLSPEEWSARAAKLAQLRRIKQRKFLPSSLGSSTIDEDFDEGLS